MNGSRTSKAEGYLTHDQDSDPIHKTWIRGKDYLRLISSDSVISMTLTGEQNM